LRCSYLRRYLGDAELAEDVLGPDAGLLASHCTSCGWTFATVKDKCPFCRARCDKTNLWQQILALALRHNVAVQFVKGNETLLDRGGVAATLCREE
jgi:hypothetical protein